MGKGRGSLIMRQKAALARLESAYETFKADKEDLKPRISTRNGGRIIHHKGRKYADECKRMADEIKILKAKISKGSMTEKFN